jgi:hypothetical protein
MLRNLLRSRYDRPVRPTRAELLRGIVHALNTVILPDLRSPHPQMTALMTSRLLEHLIAREEKLVETLRARVPELRALLAELGVPTDAAAAADSPEALEREDDALHRALEAALAGAAGRDPAALARIDAFLLREARAEVPLYERLVKA